MTTTTTDPPLVRGAGYRLSTAGGASEPVLIALNQIRIDGGTQARAGLHDATIGEYHAALAEGATFPPIVVYHDGSDYWLADGFHRVAAARRRLLPQLRAEIRQGTRRDAVLYACGANDSHGLRRTAADKRRAIETLLRDDEWGKWSDSEIARQCKVHHSTVAALRKILYPANSQDSRTVARGGTTYQMTPPAPAGWPCAKCGTLQTGMRKPPSEICTDCARALVAPPARPLNVSPFADAQARFAALGWSLQRRDDQFVLTRPDGAHYATTPDLDPQLRTLVRFEAGAAKRAAPAPAADPTAEAEIARLCAISGSRFIPGISRPDLPGGPYYRIALFGGGGGDYLADDALAKLREMCDQKRAPAPADAIPHLPPDFAAAQRRAERIGLMLSMDMEGRFAVREPATGVGLVGFWAWPDVLTHLAKMETATATRDAARPPAPVQTTLDPLAPIRTSLARATRWLAQLAGELEALVADPAVDTDDYDRLSHAIGAARRALEIADSR